MCSFALGYLSSEPGFTLRFANLRHQTPVYLRFVRSPVCTFPAFRISGICFQIPWLLPPYSFSLAYSRQLTLKAVIFIALIGGAGIWIFGQSHTIHIGASGIIFGLIGYLLAIGFFLRRELLALMVSLLVAFYYGWALFSLFIVLPGVSWTGHFFGFAAGALAGWLTRHDGV